MLELAPGVNETTPGVTGPDLSDVQRAMRRTQLGAPGLFTRQLLEDIDQALARLTQGRVRIRA
ncbi:hypothetical protein GCM10010411_74500 [Actinomadura fulvescens]|uniref:Uncharacterized protein n=1 Tax=Actinomadura fulvescens TaxID=46160 RepID=A0ABN3QHD9_9ACTN